MAISLTRPIVVRPRERGGQSCLDVFSRVASSLRFTSVRLACFVLMGAGVGQTAWSFAAGSLVIVLWAHSPTRLMAFVSMVSYTLATSWTLVPSTVQYLALTSMQTLLALGWWVCAALLSALPWAMFFRADQRWIGSRLVLLALCLSMPPLGLFQWMSPFLGITYLSPLTGWAQVAAGFVVLVVFVRNPRALIALPLLVLLSLVLRQEVIAPIGWRAMDTAIAARADAAVYLDRFEAMRSAGQAAARDSVAVMLLGESVGADDFVGARQALGHARETIFLIGGSQNLARGSEAQLWRFGRGETDGSVAYHQRVPAPVVSGVVSGAVSGVSSSSYVGVDWLSVRFDETTIDVDGYRVAPLICYEGLTAWALLSALWAKPDAIVFVTNTAWSSLDRFAHAQLSSHVRVWATLFGVPVLMASNRSR